MRAAPFDTLKLATALAEAMSDLVTHDDLKAAVKDLEQKLTIRRGIMLAAGFGLLFGALKAWP
jgi:AmiR/NasT family two-component response regulator